MFHVLYNALNTNAANTILGRFVSELHKVGVVPSNQVAAMAETLLAHGDDRSFEGLCRLLSFTGYILTRTHEVCIICLIWALR